MAARTFVGTVGAMPNDGIDCNVEPSLPRLQRLRVRALRFFRKWRMVGALVVMRPDDSDFSRLATFRRSISVHDLFFQPLNGTTLFAHYRLLPGDVLLLTGDDFAEATWNFPPKQTHNAIVAAKTVINGASKIIGCSTPRTAACPCNVPNKRDSSRS
jgi:hypothetical protein